MSAFAETGFTVSPQANTASPAAFRLFKRDAWLSRPFGGGEKQVSNSIIFFWRITLSDERLLIILCNWLKEEHARLSKKIAFLKKDLELEPSDLYVQKSIKEKESQLALITKESIEKYQAFWVPLMPHTRRPCPFCFIHGKTSNLKSVGEENGEESVKCEVCKKQFYFPSGSTS